MQADKSWIQATENLSAYWVAGGLSGRYVYGMDAKAGDRIIVESESVGTPPREGEILEVIQGEVGVRYRVRWSDGHESLFTATGGSARVVPEGRR